jgi:hypothetical protein
VNGDGKGAADPLAALGVVGRVNGFLGWPPMMHAEALARSGDVSGAIAMYEGHLFPWRALARLRLGELYESVGDVEAARENYSGFLRLFQGADADMAALVTRGRDGLARVGG